MRSEHCVSFLKGRWSSLRGLRLRIDQAEHIQYACIWIISCIILHTFAIQHESGIDLEGDQFYNEGIAWLQQEQSTENNEEFEEGAVQSDCQREAAHDVELLRGRILRQKLKEALFMYLDSK